MGILKIVTLENDRKIIFIYVFVSFVDKMKKKKKDLFVVTITFKIDCREDDRIFYMLCITFDTEIA